MKRRVRFLAFAMLPLVAATLTWSVRQAVARQSATPVLDYPKTINLGDRERGEIAIGHFTVANRGRGPLQLSRFRTSCSCTQVEREVHGQIGRVESVEIPPGQEIELAVRFGVGAPVGESQAARVVFTTNDPARPRGQIDILVPHIKGGVYAVPGAVIFGEVLVGSTARCVIELYNNRHGGRRIKEVRSLQPDRFETRLLPVEDGQPAPDHEAGGQLMARLEIVAHTNEAGSLRGWIEISLADEDREPDRLSVFGEVVQEMECRPRTLVLSGRAEDDAAMSGRAFLRHRCGQDIHPVIESAPPELSARIRRSADADFPWLLEVEWVGDRPLQQSEKTIRLRMQAGGEEKFVIVPVIMAGPPTTAAR